jgi:hypothetical protein
MKNLFYIFLVLMLLFPLYLSANFCGQAIFIEFILVGLTALFQRRARE